MKKVLFLNTAHYSKDDRTFYHQAQSVNQLAEVVIVSSKEMLEETVDEIVISSFSDQYLSRLSVFRAVNNKLKYFQPDLIIADAPVSVLMAVYYRFRHRCSVVYDITEWYPSKKNIRYNNWLMKIIKVNVLLLINLVAGLMANGFIFGEYYKSVPFKTLFPRKKNVYLPYFPDLKYIPVINEKSFAEEFTIMYSGNFTEEKGFYSVLKAVLVAATMSPGQCFRLLLIGKFVSEEEQQVFNKIRADFPANIQVEIQGFLPFNEFCKRLGNAHLFLDLRKIDLENTRCLPIKLFYYLAAGRPVIFSNLKAIRKELSLFNFGYLCNSEYTQEIAQYIVNYVSNPDQYHLHCQSAQQAAITTYNWGKIEPLFLAFSEYFINR